MSAITETMMERLEKELAYHGKPDRLKMNPDYQEMTLDQIMERDAENFRLVMKACKRYRAATMMEAKVFFVEAYRTALSKLGVTAIDKLRRAIKEDPARAQRQVEFYQKLCAKQEAEKGIVCQHREYDLEHRMRRALHNAQVQGSAARARGELDQAREYDEQCQRLLDAIRNLHNAQHDFRRTGLYIYYQDEIAYFVGDPIIQQARSQGGLILPGRREIHIWTNVPMEN